MDILRQNHVVNASENSLPDLSPSRGLDHLSSSGSCPWRYVITRDDNRIPSTLLESRCINSNCQGVDRNSDDGCRALSRSLPVCKGQKEKGLHIAYRDVQWSVGTISGWVHLYLWLFYVMKSNEIFFGKFQNRMIISKMTKLSKFRQFSFMTWIYVFRLLKYCTEKNIYHCLFFCHRKSHYE